MERLADVQLNIPVVDVSKLNREQLLANLYRTDELVKEIEILDHEIEKKEKIRIVSLDALQMNYVTDKLAQYQASEEVKAYERQKAREKAYQEAKGVALVFTVMLPLITGGILYVMKTNIFIVAAVCVISPFILFSIYHLVGEYYIKNKELTVPKTDEIVYRDARLETSYTQLENEIEIRDLKFEITQLKQQREQTFEQLRSESALKEKYYKKARRLVYYLSNQYADTIKEAILLLENDEHRKVVNDQLEINGKEIKFLRQQLMMLQEQYDRLETEVDRYKKEVAKLMHH